MPGIEQGRTRLGFADLDLDGEDAAGSHQDAIRKCLHIQKPDQPWQVAYLPGEEGAPPALLRTSDPAHPVGDFTLWAGRTPQGDWCAAIVRRPCAIVRTFSLL